MKLKEFVFGTAFMMLLASAYLLISSLEGVQ